MNPGLDQLLANLQAAEGDAAKTALAVADFASGGCPASQAVLLTAAIPHWFTLQTFTALLDEDLRPSAATLHKKLLSLPMVEDYPERGGHAVHDQTRLALRDRLLATDPELFRQLSQRAAAAYGSADPNAPDFVLTCEHVYHQLAGQTSAGDAAMARVACNWRAGFRTEPLQTLSRLLEELLFAKPSPPFLRRGHGLALLTIATTRLSRQPLEKTRELVERSVSIFRLLGEAPLVSEREQVDLALVLEQAGDIAQVQGDLPKALQYHTECKTIRERLAVSDPANAHWRHDLNVSFERLGDIAQSRGDLETARAQFELCRNGWAKLIEQDPTKLLWQRGITMALIRLGDLAMKKGDLPGALRYFTEDMRITERIAARDPANAAWQYDLGISNERLGALAVAQGKLDAALVFHTKRKDIISTLVASDPANGAWQRDLCLALGKLGELAVAQGDLAGALRCFTEAKAIAECLAASDPTNAQWQRDVAACHFELYKCAQKKGDAEMAQVELKACYTALDGMKQRGLHLDPQFAGMHAELRDIFGGAQ
jgi:tetratricopeptide (TPR) repeat protein